MAEILGVLASASQLTQYALKISAAISAVYDRVHNAPELRKGAAQIQQLLDTVIQIQQNPQAHNSAVLKHLESATEEAKSLLDLLQRLSIDYSKGSLSKRYYKAARGSKDEKKIATGFKQLEQEKSSLLFCISIGNSERLCSIQTDVLELADGMSPSRVDEAGRVQERSLDTRITRYQQENLAIIPRTAQHNICPIYDMADEEAKHKSTANQQPTDQGNPRQELPAAFSQSTTSYENCCIIGESNEAGQQNGHIGDNIVGRYAYRGCTTTGKGVQLNGSTSGGDPTEIIKSFFSRGR